MTTAVHVLRVEIVLKLKSSPPVRYTQLEEYSSVLYSRNYMMRPSFGARQVLKKIQFVREDKLYPII
ncbi:hypothetical protein RO3G_10577 [Rhizopus delemar RA 99-880]|uniref:Uncharacterized protein n=1 Tax=Rhizopus delemar (strain RA 99-880 / ATCC MYA-4621 / FGSC 9543 / NRRL 43880) TaxID=246409 RepID=I1CBN7_RHIO9|nr:hypothetical protein RO3G_10577 [Rhizopus delemar RA 99-880]|eukprot:EIE85867.1 hypothetical protein RO3G_10577 [Rhizopus delemar RA 99-880]